MSTNTTTTCVQLTNRRRAVLYNVPPTRFTPVSPYTPGGPTKYELDMRRKVEILQYKSRDTGSITKKQQFGQVVRGATQRRNSSQTLDPTSLFDCLTKPTLSTNAGVPGPAIVLYLDPTVPLYNYITTHTYAVQNVESDEKFGTTYDNNVIGNPPQILRFIVRPIVTKINHIFTLVTPIALLITGNTVGGSVNSTGTFSVNLNAADINVIVKFGDEVLTIMSTPQVSFDSGFLNTITGTTTAPTPTTTVNFSGTIFLGNLTLSNIMLPTTPGYVYDIFVQYLPSSTPQNITTFNASIISNYTGSASPNESNLDFTVTPPSIVGSVLFDGV